MKKNSILWLVTLVIGYLSFAGGVVMSEELISIPRFMEMAELSEDDVTDQDVARVIEYYSITEAKMEDVSKDEFPSLFWSLLENMGKDNRLYLFAGNSASVSELNTDVSALRQILVVTQHESYQKCLLVDLQAMKRYSFNHVSFLDDVNSAHTIADISIDEKELILKQLTDANFLSWKPLYQGNEDVYYYQQVVLEFESGMLKYLISGIQADDTEQIYQFTDALYQISADDATE